MQSDSSKPGRYICADTNKRYHVDVFTSQDQYNIINALWKRSVFGNIKGFLKKKNVYYCFSDLDDLETLSQYIENNKRDKETTGEAFCITFIEKMLLMFEECESKGYNIKILDPFHVLVKIDNCPSTNSKMELSLAYPYCHSLFEGLTIAAVNESIQFCAPEIILTMNNEFDLIQKQFPKSCLYSLGLVLLYCFGYRIKSEERIKAFKNSKEFNIFIKTIRKEIKLLHEGKFISKIIKLLLEGNEFIRDSIQTVKMKIRSPLFDSLRKYYMKTTDYNAKQSYLPTVFSDHSERMHKSRLDHTIEIQGSSSNSPQNTQNKTEYSTNRENINDLRISVEDKYTPTIKQYMLTNTKITTSNHLNIKLEMQKEGQNATSPVDIYVEWENQEDRNQKSQCKSRQAVIQHLQPQQIEHHEPDLEEDQIKMKICQADLDEKKGTKEYFSFKKQRRDEMASIQDTARIQSKQSFELFKEQKESKSVKNERKKKQNENERQRQRQVQVQVERDEMIIEDAQYHFDSLKDERGKRNGQDIINIIKYDEQYSLGKKNSLSDSPKMSRRISNEEVNLRDMTLSDYYNDQDELIVEQQATPPQSQEKNYQQKSQAIFISLLLMYLIYKVVDYFVY